MTQIWGGEVPEGLQPGAEEFQICRMEGIMRQKCKGMRREEM